MRSSRKLLVSLTTSGAVVAALMVTPSTAGATPDGGQGQAADTEYVVLVEAGADSADAVRAVEAAGGQVIKSNDSIGTLLVRGPGKGFSTRVAASPAIEGAARNRAVGKAPKTPKSKVVEQEHHASKGGTSKGGATRTTGAPAAARAVGMDPLDHKLWGLRMVRSDLARQAQPGKRAVKVAIIDTGVDGRHPDIKPNFDAAASRNFAPDMPEVDGALCEFRGCVDPASWDDNGHGTHVAGTIGAAANNFGVSGVAPNVTLLNVRAGQDSGYFFLGPTTDALAYAADAGVDVANMSFYVDPWLYNCLDNPADSAEAKAEQRTIIRSMRRALNYAHDHGVTLVGALGNNHEDLGKPREDTSSPDFPPGEEYPRPIDNATCWDLPVEGPHVIGVSSLGPSGRKSDFSNYGLERIEVSAPGGWYRDYFGTDWFRTNENLILSSYPVNALQAQGLVGPAGRITELGRAFGIMKRCPADATGYKQCGYYNYLQGTSMAAPHASGVAALIVSEYGSWPGDGTGFGLAPDTVRRILMSSAAERSCPTPRLVTYLDEGRDETYNALCEGTREFNGFYGAGIVDAYAAVTHH